MLHRLRPAALPRDPRAIFAFICVAGIALLGIVGILAIVAWPHAPAPAPESGVLQAAQSAMLGRSAARAAQPSDVTDALAAPVAAGGAPAAPARRALVKTGSLDLLVPDVDRALARMRAEVAAFGGDILELDDQRPSSASDPRTASVKLAIPERSFDRAMASLSDLGGVRSRSVAAKDVGDQLVDDDARLRNLRRTERDLLAIMDRSGKVSEILDVENQLASVRDQIERLAAERASLGTQVDDATLALTLTAEAAQQQGPAEASVSVQIGDAWLSARHAAGAFALALIARALLLIAFAPFWLAAAAFLTFAIVAVRRVLRRVGARSHPAGA